MKRIFIISLLMMLCVQVFAQNVGINMDGTPPTDPKAMLEVKKSIYSKVKIRSNSYNDTSALELSNRTIANEGTDFLITAKTEQGLYFTTASDIPAFNNDSLFTLLRSGNVGIGTRAPAYRFQLHDMGSATSYMNVSNSTAGHNPSDGLLVGMSGSSGILANLENGFLRLGTNNLTRLSIDGAGNIGIGNLSPSYKLDVNGDMNLTGNLRLSGNTGTTGQVLTSRGSSDPIWKETAYGNNTRFAFDVYLGSPGTSSSVTGGFLNFNGTNYNLDPASVSVSGSDLTISKTGLYHFEFFYIVQFFYASASTSISPVHRSYVSVDYTGFTHYIAYQQEIRRKETTTGWYYNGKASIDIYIQAPRTIQLYSVFTDLAGPTSGVVQEGQFYGHLINE